jgi:hypothetical protein
MIDGLITIAGGLLAASALIIARKPNAQQLIDKLTPYQGWIGVVLFFWGIWGLSYVLRFMSVMSPIGLVLTIAMTAADLVVGFLLGFGLITKYTLRGNAAAMARGQVLRQKLATYQGAFGLLAIAMGTLFVVLRVMSIA